MNPKLTGIVVLTFIMGGISKKNNRPYLNVSNGKNTFYVDIPEGVEVDFTGLQEDDLVELELSSRVGEDSAKLVQFLGKAEDSE